ncbi:MAG: MmcQ/YjbR family DNA-binding protein [Hellea sp.]|nr:MmcQ/YjbR family DNA-binding protein [Hellea sp.]
MDRETFNAFCQSLPHSTHVVQWGNSDVWKIGGKVYCVAGWKKIDDESQFAVSFKCSEIGFEMLRDTPGCRPAPYLASRGMKWIQRMTDEGVSDIDLKDYIRASYRIVSLGLTKKLQKELGLNQEAEI